jgi:RimJ/RimL family protein N-acetyltransferase
VGAAVFETERLRAVLWRDDHADPAFAAYSQPEMVRHLGNSATICSPLPVGDGEHEIGWHVFPAHQRNGYATESGAGAAAYGFDVLGLDEVYATIAPTNEPSLAVARRLGMEHLGRTTKYYDGIEFELFRLRRT